MNGERGPRVPRWAYLALATALLFDVWYRGHTVGPTVRELTGLRLWPVVTGETEPLDCDEAAYAYIGKRLLHGVVMYRDLTENKPPVGYAIYELSEAIGGVNELTIRLMPIPMILITIVCVWWIGLRLRGPAAGSVAAWLYALVSTDPYLFGNGANLEHAINLFATASLALLIRAIETRRRVALVASGASLAAACLVKQVAIMHLAVAAIGLLATRRRVPDAVPLRQRVVNVAIFLAGFAAVCGAAAGVLIAQGAGRAAYDDIFRYGGALATETPPEPNSPPFAVRWLTGNADPSGRLPPPFGKTKYLVWWGTGSWPFWLAGLVAIVWLFTASRSKAINWLVAGWTCSACLQVILPRLFWPHYYLLPLPGLAVCVAVLLVDLICRAAGGNVLPRAWAALGALVISAAIAATLVIQIRDYLLVAPEDLTIRYKGGAQWVTLRKLGRELAARSHAWHDPHLFVWGWQSPLYFYSGLDGVTPQVFVDPLMKAYAGTDHPLIRPRLERTMRDLNAHPPELIFAGDPPFPELRDLLLHHYVRSPIVIQTADGRGLWVARERYSAFEAQ